MFNQVLDPANNLWVTIFLALVPLIVLLFLLAVVRMTAWMATIIASAITIPIAILVWHAPAAAAIKAYFYGCLQGAWVIDWITFWGLVIFNTLTLTGDFGRFKNWTVDRPPPTFASRPSCLPGPSARCSKALSALDIPGLWSCPS